MALNHDGRADPLVCSRPPGRLAFGGGSQDLRPTKLGLLWGGNVFPWTGVAGGRPGGRPADVGVCPTKK